MIAYTLSSEEYHNEFEALAGTQLQVDPDGKNKSGTPTSNAPNVEDVQLRRLLSKAKNDIHSSEFMFD